MPTARIEAADAQSLFSKAREATRLPAGWPEPHGWQLNSVDPMHLLAVFPQLKLKPGYVLKSYLYGDSNSNGYVVAFPLGLEQICPTSEYRVFEELPEGVITDYET